MSEEELQRGQNDGFCPISRDCSRARSVGSKNKLSTCAQFVRVSDDHGWLAVMTKRQIVRASIPGIDGFWLQMNMEEWSRGRNAGFVRALLLDIEYLFLFMG